MRQLIEVYWRLVLLPPIRRFRATSLWALYPGRGTDAAASHAEPHPASLSLARQRVLWFLVISTALILSRWLLTQRYLITFDEINFALAIDGQLLFPVNDNYSFR